MWNSFIEFRDRWDVTVSKVVLIPAEADDPFVLRRTGGPFADQPQHFSGGRDVGEVKRRQLDAVVGDMQMVVDQAWQHGGAAKVDLLAACTRKLQSDVSGGAYCKDATVAHGNRFGTGLCTVHRIDAGVRENGSHGVDSPFCYPLFNKSAYCPCKLRQR